MTIATHEQQRDAVEAWARVFGFRPLHESNGADPHVAELSDAEAEPPLALAWALLVELGAGSVDVGKCPACVKRGGPMEWGYAPGHLLGEHRSDGFSIGPHSESRGFIRWALARACPACNGTGREIIPITRALLGDDAKVRACLHPEADRLLAANDPVGMALAWGLRWSEGDDEQDGTGEAAMLLHWAKIAREQDEHRRMLKAWADVYAMGNLQAVPDTVVLSPEAYDLLTNTWTISITPAEEPAEIVSVTIGNSIADAIRPAIEAIGTSLLPMPAEIPEPIDERDRPKHARHIGAQLGRRLGVRAR
jgi:hypothetical protein